MGNSKLNICLLLIVAGTATVLGSSAKQKPPQVSTESQEDERLPLNLNDYENKMENGTAKKRILGTSISLAGAAALKFLNADRTVTVTVINNSGGPWQVPGVYLKSGDISNVLPRTVGADQTLELSAYKRKLSPSGVSGVMAYYIPSLQKTLAIMFEVPNVGKNVISNNKWNVELQQGDQQEVTTNELKAMYKRLYDNALKADNNWHDVPNVPSIRGSMTKSDNAALRIEVSRP